MKKVLKGMLVFIICISIIGSSTKVSAASRSNKYMTTWLDTKSAKMTVKNEFTVDSISAYMDIYWRNKITGTTYSSIQDKTTKRTRMCNLNYKASWHQVIIQVYFEGRIEGSLATAWQLSN